MWGLLIFGVLSVMKILRVSEDMEVKGMLILQLYFMLLMCKFQNTDHHIAPKRDSPKCDTHTSLDPGEIESGSKKVLDVYICFSQIILYVLLHQL